jgi:hypothetical protein
VFFLFWFVLYFVPLCFFVLPPPCSLCQFLFLFFFIPRFFLFSFFTLDLSLYSRGSPSVFFFPPSVPSRGCLYLGFYRAGRSIGAVTAGSNGVGHSIQRRNVPAFDGGAIAEEENKRTVARPKRLRFPISKAAFSLVLGILVILQSSLWLKCNWILAFPRHFQASPWILIFAIWTPIKPQTLVFHQLSS